MLSSSGLAVSFSRFTLPLVDSTFHGVWGLGLATGAGAVPTSPDVSFSSVAGSESGVGSTPAVAEEIGAGGTVVTAGVFTSVVSGLTSSGKVDCWTAAAVAGAPTALSCSAICARCCAAAASSRWMAFWRSSAMTSPSTDSSSTCRRLLSKASRSARAWAALASAAARASASTCAI